MVIKFGLEPGFSAGQCFAVLQLQMFLPSGNLGSSTEARKTLIVLSKIGILGAEVGPLSQFFTWVPFS